MTRCLATLALGVVLVAGAACDDRCRTACDCDPGLSCADGQCLSGTAAVFCCDRCPPGAPASQTCDHPDGRRGRCGD